MNDWDIRRPRSVLADDTEEVSPKGDERGESEEVVAVDLREGARALGLLTGEITTEELLREIFAKFCIGK